MHDTALPPPPADLWYYADAAHQQRGPVGEDELLALLQQGVIGRDTLVWRSGMPQWQPLRRVIALPAATLAAAASTPAPPAAAAPAAKRGMNGCLIALIVAAVVTIPMLAIFAAIAIPAYQDYLLRAEVAALNTRLAPWQPQIEAWRAEHGTCPYNGDGTFPEADGFAIEGTSEIQLGPDEDDPDTAHCVLQVDVAGLGNDKLDGERIWWMYHPDDADEDSNGWTCSSSIADRYLPLECRG
ncbi:GYF domain-containing protein [Luteimonas sp. e5]